MYISIIQSVARGRFPARTGGDNRFGRLYMLYVTLYVSLILHVVV